MYPISNQFKDAVYAPVRYVAARVIFEILDVDAFEDVAMISTPIPLIISDTSQLHNKVRLQSANTATLEKDRFRLDGSFSFADDTDLESNGEVGYISDAISDELSEFSESQVFEFTFNSTHSSAAISLTFDVHNEEYATHIEVSAYDELNNLIESVNVVNSEVVCAVLGQFDGYKKIAVTINKWCKPYRRVRLCEVDFGIIQTYTNNELINLGYIEELDVTSSTIPPAELSFTVDNTDRRFNILNPNGFYKYLQEQQEVIHEIGFRVDGVYQYVPIGRFLLTEWTSDEGAFSASFKARNVIDLLDNYYYEQLTPLTIDLKTLAETILEQAGIKKYRVHESLSHILTNALCEYTTTRVALQMIAIASCSCVYVTRDNTLILEPITIAPEVDYLSFDNVFSEPKIELEKICRQVNVDYYTDLENATTITTTLPNVSHGDVLEVKENTFINTPERALIVANWILNQKQLRTKQTADWRFNPAIELADTVKIENSYGTVAKGIVVQQEYSFAGSLKGKAVTKGASL